MRIASQARGLAAALAIALILVAASAIGSVTVAQASGQSSGGPKILTCEPRSNDHAADPTSDGAPDTGPTTATDASNDRTGNPLWCISGVSGDHAPEFASADCESGGGTTGDVTIDSSRRGFDWVC
jgi:hypothetical protein